MKQKKGLRRVLPLVLVPVLAAAVLLCFMSAVKNLDRGHAGEDMRRLEDVLRRAVVACYAAEGRYPPDLAYVKQRYGVQIDEKRYMVDYIFVADNLMPDITVLEKW